MPIRIIGRIQMTAADSARADSENEFVIAELNHRFRNLLNLVRSLISQSQTSTTSVAEFARDIGNRIESLARAHDQLTTAHHAPVSLHRLIAAEARAYTQGNGHPPIILSGENAMIAPRAVTTLTLVLHELMTNARKYGSLSLLDGAAGGLLEITTAREPNGDLVLHWQESGGPPVEKPTRRGFGTTILERSIPHDLGGTVLIEYTASGVAVRIGLPARHLVDDRAGKLVSDSASAITPQGTGAVPDAIPEAATNPGVTSFAADMPQISPATLRPRFTALVVEDNMLIAMDAEEALYEFGASEVKLCANVAAALASIANSRDGTAFDVALLDVNLGDETSEAIAMALREAAIPFVITTGFGDYVSDISAYAGAPVLTKPYAPDALSQALAQLMD
ncbi:MAG: response regulator [Pseudomonadota bacterium]|nr:response regulator [Pseudomonadota bacterium]